MNCIYRVVFNKAVGCWQAVSEIASGRTGGSSGASAPVARAASTAAAEGGGLRSVAVAAAMLLAVGSAVAGGGGAGGRPANPVLWGGAGGNDSTGGAGATNDTDYGSHGGNGGNATPGGPTAGSNASIGTLGADPTFLGGDGAGGAAGTAAAPNGAPGQNDPTNGNGFGGGGGAGHAGATGPLTSNTGTVLGGNGGNGGNGFWAAGGGGAGGYGAVVDPSVTSFSNSGSISGGRGGDGGSAASQGGGGGGGGTGVYFAPANPASIASNTGTITGGNGGNGGDGLVRANRSSGGGGGGGNGIALMGGQLNNAAGATIGGGNGGNGGIGNPQEPTGKSGSGGGGGNAVNVLADGAQVFNAGNLAGGNGGVSGASTTPRGSEGAAGVGVNVVGDGNSVFNAGSIAGGLGGDGVTRGDAVAIAGNNNTLELQSGYAFTGNAVATGAANAFALGGNTDAAFDTSAIGNQYQGFTDFRKTGTSTWTLNGIQAGVTPWIVKAGTLSIANDASLGDLAGALTLDGGALQTTADIATTRQINLGAGGGTLLTNAGTTLGLRTGMTGTGGLAKSGAGTLELSGANNYTGATTINAGTVRAGAANTLSAASAHTVAAGATLDLAGRNETVASLSNGGTVSLLGAAPGTTLTVTGPYVGHNGVLRLGTVLGDSSSPSDRLVLSGAAAVASGTTSVQVTQLGGLGARTTGNGIEVIGTANGGSIGANAFTLAGGHVDAGAFEYRLKTTATGGYLSSEVEVAPPPPQPPQPPQPSQPSQPAQPSGTPEVVKRADPTAPAVTIPAYRAEVPLLAALPEQFRQRNYAMLGNLHQRVGDDAGMTDTSRQGWARVISIDDKIRQQGTVSPSSSGRVTGFQAGTDLLVMRGWRAGLYVGQLDGDMDVRGFSGGLLNHAVGSNDLRNEYLGAYATYHGTSGFYADTVVQAGRHRYTSSTGTTLPISGKGDSLIMSLELGQSFALTPNWTIEPQVQIAHQSLSLDSAWIPGSTLVRQWTTDGWLARAGVRVKGDITTPIGTLQPYGRVNLYASTNGTDVTNFGTLAGNTAIYTQTGGSSGEVAVGATLAVTQAVSLYSELGKLWAIGGDTRVRSSLNGGVGVKVRW